MSTVSSSRQARLAPTSSAPWAHSAATLDQGHTRRARKQTAACCGYMARPACGRPGNRCLRGRACRAGGEGPHPRPWRCGSCRNWKAYRPRGSCRHTRTTHHARPPWGCSQRAGNLHERTERPIRPRPWVRGCRTTEPGPAHDSPAQYCTTAPARSPAPVTTCCATCRAHTEGSVVENDGRRREQNRVAVFPRCFPCPPRRAYPINSGRPIPRRLFANLAVASSTCAPRKPTAVGSTRPPAPPYRNGYAHAVQCFPSCRRRIGSHVDKTI
jgi:hypothetical protein